MSFPTTEAPDRCNFDPAYFPEQHQRERTARDDRRVYLAVRPRSPTFVQGIFHPQQLHVRGLADFVHALPLPATSPWYPHAFAARSDWTKRTLDVRWRSVDLGGRTSEPVLLQWNVVAGLKGHARRMALRLGVHVRRQQRRRSLYQRLCSGAGNWPAPRKRPRQPVRLQHAGRRRGSRGHPGERHGPKRQEHAGDAGRARMEFDLRTAGGDRSRWLWAPKRASGARPKRLPLRLHWGKSSRVRR
jgi:hypothetical protein